MLDVSVEEMIGMGAGVGGWAEAEDADKGGQGAPTLGGGRANNAWDGRSAPTSALRAPCAPVVPARAQARICVLATFWVIKHSAYFVFRRNGLI